MTDFAENTREKGMDSAIQKRGWLVLVKRKKKHQLYYVIKKKIEAPVRIEKERTDET